MLVLDDLKEINDVIKDIALFVQRDEVVKPDFEEYLKTIGVYNNDSVNFQSACFNYIFERNLGENNESIFDLFLTNSKKLSAGTKKIVKELIDSVSSVFEVKKLLKNGFELYNIVNERVYDVTSLVKMTSFRGIGVGQFVVARIFNHMDSCYLLEISGVLPSYRKDEAFRYAVAKIIQNPEYVYLDNPKKQKEIESEIKSINKKFLEFFGTDEIITTNKFADDLIGMFNDYCESGEKKEYQDKIQLPEEYKFFDVSEFNNSYDNFLENSLGGFSSHSQTYDVGIIFDEELGLYAIPFYATFDKIFKAEKPENISGYAECINYFLANDKYSANIIKRIASKHENFMDIVNTVLGSKYTLDELLAKYKSRYLNHKIFSSTTVLYKSKAFSSTLGIIEEHEDRPEVEVSGVGRNEPCPCGSGKKFKKCCGGV